MSLSSGDIPYNMQMDIERLCLENALKRFLDSGEAKDAFDVYFCYLEMFIGKYGDSKEMVEMLSEFEINSGALLMKHRDHYSHSVYVFALGLALYETNTFFKDTYNKFYGFGNDESEKKQGAYHFLEYWGLTSLFHDIGYPFELPYEQVASYFELQDESRDHNPFLAYHKMEHLSELDKDTTDILRNLYDREFDDINDLFAFDIVNKLEKVYDLDVRVLKNTLSEKPEKPDSFGYFMDHAYFSATLLFRELREIDKDRTFTKERIDALSAIILHNSLYKFSIAFYKDSERNKPFEAHLHPLAYMLMVCDELQCWDRRSYGRNSRSELHPMDCDILLSDGHLKVTYVFDDAEIEKIDAYELAYIEWEKDKEQSKPKLKNYASMVHENDFLRDIESIANVKPLGIDIITDIRPANHMNKSVYLSYSNFEASSVCVG